MAANAPYTPPNTDQDTRLFAQSTFDLLLIEIVPMAGRLAERVWREDREMEGLYLVDKDNAVTEGRKTEEMQVQEVEIREAVYYRLERLGWRVGVGLVESLTINTPLLSRTDALDTMKFICKDLWLTCFRKQIDNLKTNHRGVFVLTDNSFYLLKRASLPAPASGAAGEDGVRLVESLAERARPFLWFPCGLVKGALVGCGWDVESVRAEVGGTTGTGAVFTVRLNSLTSGVK